MKLETLNGDSLVDAFSSMATGFVDAANGTDPSLSVMYASLIPPSVAPDLPEGTIVAKVRVFGSTLRGQDVESSELSFPIQICNGCLVSYPAEARDPAAAGTDYMCLAAASESAGSGSRDAELPCTLGIDLPAPMALGLHQEHVVLVDVRAD